MIEIEAPRLRQLYSEWEGWRGSREFPSRADFDPLALKYLMGNLSLLDVHYDPLRFHYRVHATEVTKRLGFDLTGKSLELWPDPAMKAVIHDSFAGVVESRVPTLRRRKITGHDGRPWQYESILLPLAADGVRIDMLMVAFEFAL